MWLMCSPRRTSADQPKPLTSSDIGEHWRTGAPVAPGRAKASPTGESPSGVVPGRWQLRRSRRPVDWIKKHDPGGYGSNAKWIDLNRFCIPVSWFNH
jgi:hypothetical protein